MESSQGVRALSGAAVAALTVLLLAGCGSLASEPTASPTVTVAPTAAPRPSAPASTAPATTAAPAPTATVTVRTTPEPTTPRSAADPDRPAGQCADSDLGVTIAVADGGGGAGSEYYNVLFTNTGGTSCVLRGTPGVSVVGNGNGTQLGRPAERSQAGVKTVALAVGQTVAAPLQIVNIGSDGGPLGSRCAVKRGDGYRVYAPHSRRAFFAENADAVACTSGTSFMVVSPVTRFTD